MTELTLDKQIKQFPSVTEFVDAQGDELYFGADGDLFFLKHECRIWKHFFSHISIPGLRPKPRKVKKTIKGFVSSNVHKSILEGSPFIVTISKETDLSRIPIEITIEVEE